jgi:hypothetical protein
MIALSASAIIFGVAAMALYAYNGWKSLAVSAGVLAAFGVLVWLSLQVYRSRLLGGAVRVSAATLPELQAVLDEVRRRLGYRKHVDVYVMGKVDGGSAMTSYLGTRLIQLDGGLVADLLGDEHYAELTYLIARHIGQLKARHQRLLPIFLAVSVLDSLKFLQVFLAPYLRATARSGDQIAAACCGDVRATAATMNRLLAGKDLGPRLAIRGVLDQAATVRHRWLPRAAQLFMSVPHATNRYLNLLTFFARVAPGEINAWLATLDEATASRLAAAIEASPNRRPPRRHPGLLSMLLAVLVTGGVLAGSGWLIFRPANTTTAMTAASAPSGTAGAANGTAQAAGSANFRAPGDFGSTSGQSQAGQSQAGQSQAGQSQAGQSQAGQPQAGQPQAGQSQAGQSQAGQSQAGQSPASPGTVAASQQLLVHVPQGFAPTCQPIAVPAALASQGADAEVTCQPGALGSGGSVAYVHYRTQAAMQTAYAAPVQGLPSGDCSSGPSQSAYVQGSSSQAAGDVACYDSATGRHLFAWTDNKLNILSVATSDSMTLADLYGWWLGDAGPD